MKYVLVLLSGMISTYASGQPSSSEIIRRANDLMQGNSNRTTMTMRIIRPKWSREISMKSWSLGTEYSLVVVTAPARDEGTGFLKREKELWNWQPSIDRVIKMPPSMMMQSWMGSDFTNDDLVKESSIVDDYDHNLEKDTVINGYEAWKIVLIPREEAAVVWGKVVAYIEKEFYFQLLFRYYDEDGYLVNEMRLSEIQKMGGRTLPTRMEMIPAENPDQKTVVIYEDMEFNIDLGKDFFSIQRLKQMK